MLIVKNIFIFFFWPTFLNFLSNVSEIQLFCFTCLDLISILKKELLLAPPNPLSFPSFFSLFDHIKLYLILLQV